MTHSLGTLLTSTNDAAKKLWKPIVIGAVLFALVGAAGQMMFMQSAINTMPVPMGDLDRLEERADRIEDGDQAAMMEMMDAMGVVGEDGELDQEMMENMAAGVIKNMLPTFSGFMLIMMLVSIVASAYYFVLAIHKDTDFKVAFSKTPSLILPLLGVWIWSFLRSFAWIPLIGFVFAFIIGPRLVCSPVILIKEKKGVMESVRLSYERTRGYWGKIVGNIIAMAILLVIVLMLIGMATELVIEESVMMSALLAGFLQWCATGYASIFTVKLAETVMSNQLKA